MLLLQSVWRVPISLFAKTQNITDLIKRANAGNADAQYQIGKCYAYGIGADKNAEKAFMYSQKSANQGYAAGEIC